MHSLRIILVRYMDVIVTLYIRFTHCPSPLPNRNTPSVADIGGNQRIYSAKTEYVLRMHCVCIAYARRMSSAIKILCSSKILATEKRAFADNCERVRMSADSYKHVSRILRMFSEYKPILCAVHTQIFLNASGTGP